MIAKIVTKDREYYSYVFAKFNPGFNETVIVFDNECEKFELINVYDIKPSLKRKIFIIDTDIEGMIKKEKIKLSQFTNANDFIDFTPEHSFKLFRQNIFAKSH